MAGADLSVSTQISEHGRRRSLDSFSSGRRIAGAATPEIGYANKSPSGITGFLAAQLLLNFLGFIFENKEKPGAEAQAPAKQKDKAFA